MRDRGNEHLSPLHDGSDNRIDEGARQRIACARTGPAQVLTRSHRNSSARRRTLALGYTVGALAQGAGDGTNDRKARARGLPKYQREQSHEHGRIGILARLLGIV